MASHATVRNQELALDDIVKDYEQIMLIAVSTLKLSTMIGSGLLIQGFQIT